MTRCERFTFLAILSCLIVSTSCDFQLQLLHVVFRHGDKVPHREFQNYPNDPYRDYSYHPMGNGDLTNSGKMREYKIGRMLRERYHQYFGEDYSPEMVYARSTDVPRTQLSLQLVLAGLFPPSERQTWNPRLPWIPVWTFSVPYEVDNLLFPHLCPRYKEEYATFLQRDDIQQLIDKHKNVMSYLTKHSGKVINTTGAVQYLYNLLKEEAAQNLTLPEWTKNVYPDLMKDITALDFELRTYTKALKRLSGGTLLRRIVEDIEEYRAGKLTPVERKAFLFSGHEVNVAALVRTLGTNDPVIPAYGATVILETLRDKKGTYYVRVLLWSGVTEQLTIQTIPSCTEVCPFEQFIELMRDVIPNDDEYYCRSKNGKNEKLDRQPHLHSSSSTATSDRFILCILVAVTFAVSSMSHVFHVVPSVV